MSPRRRFFVLAEGDSDFVSARCAADAITRSCLPRKDIVAVVDEQAVAGRAEAKSLPDCAPYFIVVGRPPGGAKFQTIPPR